LQESEVSSTGGIYNEGKTIRKAHVRKMQDHQAQRPCDDHMRKSQAQAEAGLGKRNIKSEARTVCAFAFDGVKAWLLGQYIPYEEDAAYERRGLDCKIVCKKIAIKAV
jgi:hypothetical protein